MNASLQGRGAGRHQLESIKKTARFTAAAPTTLFQASLDKAIVPSDWKKTMFGRLKKRRKIRCSQLLILILAMHLTRSNTKKNYYTHSLHTESATSSLLIRTNHLKYPCHLACLKDL